MKRIIFLVSLVLIQVTAVRAAVINTIEELDAAAEFQFSIISDNKTNGSGDTRTNRAITWIKAVDEFCFGLGDNMKSGPGSDGFDNVLRDDNWWNNNFYPHIGDGECEAYTGSQSGWPNGANFFREVNNWNGRSNVFPNSLEPTSSDGFKPSYHARFLNVNGSGINLHLLSGAWSDSRALDNNTRDWIYDKVTELGATKTGNDIIMILGHDNGGWVSKAMTSGKFNESQMSFIIDTVDFIGDASSHSHGRHITSDSKFEETPSNAIKTQLTQSGAALWMNSGHVKSQATSRYGYLQFHVFSSPTRFSVQYIDLDQTSRKLITPGKWGGNSNFRDPVLKEVNGPITYVNWNNFSLEAPPNDAEFVSQSVPTYMNPGETQQVSITFKNVGQDTWTTSNGHSLGTQNPQGNSTWTGANRVALSGNVAPDANHTFTFNITAPAVPGAYDFRWQMTDDSGANIGFFGDMTTNITVGVGLVSLDVTASDDTEEQLSTGNIAGSSDLEFIHADEGDPDRGDQMVGIRFSNVAIPKGVVVSNAYVQFTGDAASAGSGANITLNIAGHDTDNSGAFADGNSSDVSGRTKTSASVNWNPPAWSAGSTGTAERSNNISSVIQEIIDRAGWNSGNSLSLIISGNQGLGSAARRAESLEGVAGKGPVLHVEYGSPSDEPLVSSTTPANSQTGVSIGLSQIAIDFSKSMNGASVGSAASISGAGATGLSYGSGDGSDSITLNIAGSLQFDTTYNVIIGTGAQSSDGFNLENAYQFSFTTAPDTPQTSTIDVTVSEDTEEQLSTGNIAGSSDLEFIHADEGTPDRGDQVVGLRFSNVAIPKGVVVSNAYVQFTGDAASAGSGANITLNIAGHDTDNSGGFADGNTSDVSGRTKTSASVNWNPPVWAAGSTGAAERSSNIASVIQEIIDRAGWSSGNSLSLIISGTQGLGSAARRAESLEGVAGKAPVLHVEFGAAADEPIVSSTSPSNAETGVSSGITQLTLGFSKAMNGSSVGSAATISGAGATGLNYSSGNGTNSITLDIAGSLQDNTTYIVTIGTGAQSSDGFNMDSSYQFSFTTGGGAASTQTFVPSGDTWKYLDNGSNQGTGWRANSFNDSGWASGPAPLGYSNPVSTTVSYGPDDQNKYTTTYFRKSFNVTNAAGFSDLTLRVMRDDGAVIYLNGNEIRRENMPSGTINFDTLAASRASGTDETTFFESTIPASHLQEGTNVIAVELHQDSLTSSDVSFDLELIGNGGGGGGGPSTSTSKYRLSIRDNGATSMVIGWSDDDADVGFGTTDHGIDYNAYPNKITAAQTIDTVEKGLNHHFARLSGLTPDTVYYFVVKSGNHYSPRMSFKTLPAGSGFTMVTGGDSRTNRSVRQDGNRLVAKLRPQAIIFCGDFTNSNSDSEWNDWLNDWQLTISTDGRMQPVIPVLGNHEDYDVGTITGIFDAKAGYFSVELGDMFVASLISDGDVTTQATWLQSELINNQDKRWRVTSYHKPMAVHTTAKGDWSPHYNAWAQLHYDWNVQLSVDGDSHVSKTTYPVRPDAGGEDGFVRDDANGTVFAGEGCWGAPLRPYDNAKSWTRKGGSFNQFKWMHVEHSKITLRTVKFENVNNVGTVSDNNPYVAPAGISLHGDDVEILGAPTDPEGPAGYTYCADENGSFALPGPADVAYGANGQFSYLYLQTGTVNFNNGVFGDPIPGTPKHGFYKLLPADNTAPTPNPASFASAPNATGTTSITMTATTGSDPSGVEYFFSETSGNSGGSDSGWQSSASYTDTGLQASTQYTYTVKMRDIFGNETSNSSGSSATTDTPPDTTAPNPNPMTFAIAPQPVQGDPLGVLTAGTLAGNNPATGAPWAEGDTYRLAFVTSTTRDAASNNIADYNAFVQSVADASSLGLDGATWKVIGSTAAIDARDNTATNTGSNGTGEAIFLVDGSTVIANNYADLWDGSIDALFDMDENGNGGMDVSPATGSTASGTKRDRHLGGSDEVPAKIEYGDSTKLSGQWALIFNGAPSSNYHFYALSDPISIGVPGGDPQTQVTMTATTATDLSGVQYYFAEKSGNPGGTDSGWQSSPIYTDSGLTAGTQYSYTVTARDMSPAQNTTSASSPAFVTTNSPPMNDYDAWKTTHSVTQDLGDDDSDGMSNLIEFALGGDPNSEDAGTRMPDVNENGANIEFSFNRSESTVTYVIEKSTDLSTWTDHVTVTDSHGVVGSTAIVNVPTSEMSNGKLFLRLRVEN